MTRYLGFPQIVSIYPWRHQPPTESRRPRDCFTSGLAAGAFTLAVTAFNPEGGFQMIKKKKKKPNSCTCLACNILRIIAVKKQLDPRNSRDSGLIEHLEITILRLHKNVQESAGR
jgi:hypothetical protein